MPNINHVFMAGHLTRDPDKRAVGDSSVCEFGLAVSEKFKGKDGSQRENVCFIDVVAWGRTSDLCAEYLHKGAPVMVEGKLQFDQWEKEGERRSKHRIRADRVHFLRGKRDGQEAARPPTHSPAPGSGGKVDDQDIPF